MRTLFLLLIFSLSTQASYAQLDFFEGTYEEAQAVALSEGKLLFLDFYADWCMPCKQMERYGFRDKEFAEMISADFVAYKVDVDMFAGMDVAEAFKVNKYPTLIVSDAKGKEKKRSVGYQTAEELKELLKGYLR
jgi:thiol:disulfide interchange protein